MTQFHDIAQAIREYKKRLDDHSAALILWDRARERDAPDAAALKEAYDRACEAADAAEGHLQNLLDAAEAGDEAAPVREVAVLLRELLYFSARTDD